MAEPQIPRTLLLQILANMGFLTEDRIGEVIDIQQEEENVGQRRLVGEILVAEGYLTWSQVEAGLEEQRKRREEENAIKRQYTDSLGEILQTAATIAGICVAAYAGLLALLKNSHEGLFKLLLSPPVFLGLGISGELSIAASMWLLWELMKKLERQVKELFIPGPFSFLFWGMVVLGFVYLLLISPASNAWFVQLLQRVQAFLASVR